MKTAGGKRLPFPLPWLLHRVAWLRRLGLALAKRLIFSVPEEAAAHELYAALIEGGLIRRASHVEAQSLAAEILELPDQELIRQFAIDLVRRHPDYSSVLLRHMPRAYDATIFNEMQALLIEYGWLRAATPERVKALFGALMMRPESELSRDFAEQLMEHHPEHSAEIVNRIPRGYDPNVFNAIQSLLVEHDWIGAAPSELQKPLFDSMIARRRSEFTRDLAMTLIEQQPGYAAEVVRRIPRAYDTDVFNEIQGLLIEHGWLRAATPELTWQLAMEMVERHPEHSADMVARMPRTYDEKLFRSISNRLAKSGWFEFAPPDCIWDIFAALIDRRDDNLWRQYAAALGSRDPELVMSQLNLVAPAIGMRQESYSQEGEDLVLRRIFGEKTDGFYVDVGAHHPLRFSNTFLLYRLGWRGINIDAMPNSMQLFRELRPRDINIECLVGSHEASQSYYIFNEAALNTTSLDLARRHSDENPVYQVQSEVKLNARRLDSILGEFLPEDQTIDLLNVDVEGADLDVLNSNDWNKFRPSYILVELLDQDDRDVQNHVIAKFLHSKHYKLSARFFNTVMFKADLAH